MEGKVGMCGGSFRAQSKLEMGPEEKEAVWSTVYMQSCYLKTKRTHMYVTLYNVYMLQKRAAQQCVGTDVFIAYLLL